MHLKIATVIWRMHTESDSAFYQIILVLGISVSEYPVTGAMGRVGQRLLGLKK